MYKVIFYETPRGDCPFEDFLDCKPAKIKVKFRKFIKVLGGFGPDLKRPYADVLRDGIRELRVNQYRALYFFIFRKYIVITHAIIKKTNEVPSAEIERSIRYKKDFLVRIEKGEIRL